MLFTVAGLYSQQMKLPGFQYISRLFDFSSGQLKFLAVLGATATVMAVYLLVSAYARPTDQTVSLEVFIGPEDQAFTGVFMIDPNTAPADSLELLPGIGRVLADRIVAYREDRRFETAVDITDVKGIGPKLYERLRPYLRVSP